MLNKICGPHLTMLNNVQYLTLSRDIVSMDRAFLRQRGWGGGGVTNVVCFSCVSQWLQTNFESGRFLVACFGIMSLNAFEGSLRAFRVWT